MCAILAKNIFYCAEHGCAWRGTAIVCHLSVRSSVTLVDCDHKHRVNRKV